MKLETTKRHAQYAEARRAQVALEDALPDGEALEATLREWHELSIEIFETRNHVGIFLKEKGNGPAVNPRQTANLTPVAEQVKPPRVPLPKFDGGILQFKSFWDQFESSTHQGRSQRHHKVSPLEIVSIWFSSEGNRRCYHLCRELPGSSADSEDPILSTPRRGGESRSECDECEGVFKRRSWGVDQAPRRFEPALPRAEGLGQRCQLRSEWFSRHLANTEEETPVWNGDRMENLYQGQERRRDTFGRILAFLFEQARIKDTDIGSRTKAPTKGHQQEPHLNARKSDLRFTTAAVQMESDRGCAVCKGDHLADRCPRFRSYSVQQRRHWAMRLKLCFVCLAQGHRRERCQKRKSNQFWNPLLAGDAVPAGKAPTKQATSAACSHGTDSTEAKASLSRNQNEKVEDGSGEGTSPVGIHLSSTEGRTKLVNCLLDSGSERSLIRSDVADELDLQGPPRAMTVKGVNGLHVRIADVRRVQFRLTPIPPKGLEPFKEGIELTALSLPSLCDDLVATPTPWFCKDKIPSLPSNEITPGRVQIDSIIGLDVYFQVLGQGVRRGGPNDPVAIETIFGWILGILPATEDAKAEPALTRFEESVSFDGQRYSVGLLWKPGASPLPNKLEMAKRRLRSLRHRLARDPDKEREYADVIQSYLDQGWAEEVPDESGPIGRTWYLPHHAVYQDSPGKAKCRVVFDGSAEMNGASLNRCFEPGPKLQPDLVAILLRFRRSRIGIQADIEKMYLQIGLRPEDRDVCRFLWQAAGSKSPARIYRLTRALAGKLLSDMYVDDLATSCDRIGQARTLIRKLCNLMKSGDFAMKKWSSNDPAALSDLPVEVTSPPLETSQLWKTLGLYWNRQLDVLTFVPPAEIPLERHDTKRQLALWFTGIEWDDPLPAEINGKWISWKDELERLSAVRVQCALVPVHRDQVGRSELHVYGDASEAAYGAVAYLLTQASDGVPQVLAKARVGPIKRLSLPRLELIASLLAARLKAYITKEMGFSTDKQVCWSDSSVALSWIKGDPRKWKTFVANRVQEIIPLTEPSQWRYVPTADNPADRLSRGCTLGRLLKDHLWWNGPDWLQQPESEWPRLSIVVSPEEARGTDPERRTTVALTTTLPEHGLQMVIDPTRYSRMEKLLRVTAYCGRWVDQARRPRGERRGSSSLTLLELQEAEKKWVREVQAGAFPTHRIGSGSTEWPKNSQIASLSPFVDMEGLLRVGGRLTNAALPWCHKHPLLLPPDGTIVALIVRRAHESELHAGVNQTLAALRRRYWVIRGRQAVKRCIRSCIICRRQDGRPFCPLMSELPVARVEPTFPFSHVGLDFAGPLHVRDEDHGVRKVYICLFTCMVTRAVHIEIVADMTTTSFLAAFRRFVARRGTPEVIQSDNFRTFKQADAFIRSLFVGKRIEQFQNELACRCIQWKYTTERAPWSGGYWERLVRSVKNALRKVLGRSLLRFDELRTTLCELEARINNRPLTLLSEDPKDCAPLTPAHFLIGRELAALPTSSGETPSGTGGRHLGRRWRHQQLLMRHLWKRWTEEYLVNLNVRGKWKKIDRQPEVDDLVLVTEDTAPRNRWKMGVITELLPGSDGIVRSVRLRTARGVLTRPSRLLVLLEPAKAW
ncbi:hypothetical protein T01_6882 [Trichinella spiralis]|uniref:Integrase catalytic domain-containing protein n=1 Tax=Trichinella spiralis TaxID=6334 RepID=A0A0V1ATY1_TRISP|nr:hypothetical protein T01_6882 [Trichinella spiralis]